MKIAVNTRLLIENKLTGIGCFALESIQRIAKSHPEHTFYFIFDRTYSEKFITSSNIIPIILAPKVRHHPVFLYYWFEFSLPKLLKKIKPDLFLSPDGFLSLKTKIPALIVIHDINFEHYPRYLPKFISWYYRYFTPKFVRHAKRIATVSEYSKKDIQKQYGISANKIDVVYNGSNNLYKPVSEEIKNAVKEKYANSNDFFLFVGALHPRKNISNQLLAFDIFRNANPNLKHKFLIAGDKWYWTKEMEIVFKNLKHKNDVVFTKHLPTEKLSLLVASATALMYVSIFEGFGIPIIEAFETETPVITSNTTSMPEVAGDAALIVNPFSPDDIADSMREIAVNTNLKNELIERGCQRKKLFSWDKTADLLWKSIEKCF